MSKQVIETKVLTAEEKALARKNAVKQSTKLAVKSLIELLTAKDFGFTPTAEGYQNILTFRLTDGRLGFISTGLHVNTDLDKIEIESSSFFLMSLKPEVIAFDDDAYHKCYGRTQKKSNADLPWNQSEKD